MLRIFIILFIWLTLSHAALVHADHKKDPHAYPSSIILAPGSLQITLNKSIQWLKAEHSNLSLGQLQSSHNSVFQNINEGAVLKEDQVYWLRMRMINPTKNGIPLALSLSPKNMMIEAAYSKSEGTWAHLTHIKSDTLLTGHSSLVITIEGRSDSWVYLRIKAITTTKLEAQLKDLDDYIQNVSAYQQLIGASIACIFIVILLHLTAIQTHNHVRHYLIVLMGVIAIIYIASHAPSSILPQWLIILSNQSPWIIASLLALSSFKTEFYKQHILSSSNIFLILSLVLIGLILVNLSYITLLSVSLIPAIYAAYNASRVSRALFISCVTFIVTCSWSLLYTITPATIHSPTNMHEVYGFVLTVLCASGSMITPYFRRQTARQKPTNITNQSPFLSQISHDFRTPMNGVLGMAELLKDTPLSQQQRSFLSTIEQSGHDLLRLINRVSDMGKLQSGKLQSEKTSFDLIELIEKVIERHTPLAEQNQVEIILNIDPVISSNILCDEDRLNTVLDNLVLNALSKTKQGELEIKIHWIDEKKQDQLFFTIRDSGKGLDKETLKQIINSHNQITNPTLDIQNIDFGLFLSKHIIEALQGAFYIESSSKIGTTIRFSMQVATDHSQQANLKFDTLKGLSLLVVDDNSTFRTVIQQYANSWGAHADATYNGKEALALLRNHKTIETPYDIMLIDQDMPIMNGFQLASKIQDDPDINQDIIKIMLTGSSITSQDNLALDAGIHQVITKPVTARALQTILAKHVMQRNQRK